MQLISNTLKAAFLPLTVMLAALTGCGETNVDPNSDRGPLGKADSVSDTCAESCGGQSEGACWCDEECANYGDCCEDKVEICDGPIACGGWLGDTCGDTEFCEFEASAICGWADASGLCAPRPEACIEIFQPVCGCDGQTYSNSCKAANAGTSVASEGACEVQPIFCGGFGAIQCPDGLTCVDDPNDGCDVENGGADCGGICVEELGTIDSCEGACGEQSDAGCWCDDSCASYGDCCEDIDDVCSEPERVAASGVCVKNSNDECQTDDDCNIGGCGAELCFNADVSNGISTCECSGPAAPVSGCGCVEGSCSWYNE